MTGTLTTTVGISSWASPGTTTDKVTFAPASASPTSTRTQGRGVVEVIVTVVGVGVVVGFGTVMIRYFLIDGSELTNGIPSSS
jgi:hypothetical protein